MDLEGGYQSGSAVSRIAETGCAPEPLGRCVASVGGRGLAGECRVDRRERWTVSLGLSQLSGSVEIPTTILMAGSVVLTLPIIIIFFATERLLTGGLTAGAEKG